MRLRSAVGRLARPANRLKNSVRRVARPAARLPLRVRLVAAVGILLTAALVLISVASAVELRSYLIQRTDDEITAFAYRLNASGLPSTAVQRVLPSDYVVAVVPPSGTGVFYMDESLSKDELPDLVATVSEASAHLDVPYTVSAQNGRSRWRMFVTVKANGQILIVGERLHNVDDAVDRLIATELLVGLSALVLLTTVGVMIVRSSLAPLLEIERTAGAIARGDLTQRVPESDPETEVGRLAQALNAMLTQIEGAFRARAASEAAAQRSQQQAIRSEERMRQFVADASHELRTPLTTIRGFAELYRQGAAREPAQTAGAFEWIEAEASRMGLLVEDLLMLARLDEERPLSFGPVRLAPLLLDAATAARAVAPQREITVELPVAGPAAGEPAGPAAGQAAGGPSAGQATVAAGGPSAGQATVAAGPAGRAVAAGGAGAPEAGAAGSEAAAGGPTAGAAVAEAGGADGGVGAAGGAGTDVVVSGDEPRLRQVIGNLVTNALTHTPPGTPVALRLHVTDSAAIVEVADRGPGLTPEQAERVFERFYRVDKARTRRAAGKASSVTPHSGTGLGLAIVAALVAAHAGTVEVRSTPGQGAVFQVRLPLARPLTADSQRRLRTDAVHEGRLET